MLVQIHHHLVSTCQHSKPIEFYLRFFHNYHLLRADGIVSRVHCTQLVRWISQQMQRYSFLLRKKKQKYFVLGKRDIFDNRLFFYFQSKNAFDWEQISILSCVVRELWQQSLKNLYALNKCTTANLFLLTKYILIGAKQKK